MADLQLLLAEVRLEGGKAAEAAALFQPLVDAVAASKPGSIDTPTRRTFLGAVRAYLAADDPQRAGAAVLALVGATSDEAEANLVLVDFAKLLGVEVKRADAAEINAGASRNRAQQDAAKATAAKVRAVQAKLLEQLATRKEHALASLIYLGDACVKVGLKQQARTLLEDVLKRAEADEEFRKSSASAITRARAQLVGLLRDERKFNEALEQVESLIESNPNALDLLMEKGRILQTWSEEDPSHFDAAVAHWTRLRTLMARLSRKPPEYYEVVYNAANCLVIQSEKSSDPSKASDAEKLLNAILFQAPQLNGEDTVARYKALIQKAEMLQGRGTQ
jgi:hypothetical protein